MLENIRPFLRWAGSKSRYSSYICQISPQKIGRYYEPFLGSGSVFFALQPVAATIADCNKELIKVFTAVRDMPGELIAYIQTLPTDKETYYRIRDFRSDDPLAWAAEFIYLNRLCWNGLYRVNLAGKFNVPYGSQKKEPKVDISSIHACSSVLQSPSIHLLAADFEEVCDEAKEGDFVFFDPPYVTSHNQNGFIEYNENIFSWSDQIRLERTCRRLHDRGVNFVLTNANHHDLFDLYDGFARTTRSRISTLAADKRFRKLTSELIVSNFSVE